MCVRTCVRSCSDTVKAVCNYLASHKPTYRRDGLSREGTAQFRISQGSGTCVSCCKCHIEARRIEDRSLGYGLISSALKAFAITLAKCVFLMSRLFEII